MGTASKTAFKIGVTALIISLSPLGCGKDAVDLAADAGQAIAEPPPPPAPLTQDQLAELYTTAKTRFEATQQLPPESLAELEADLRRVANESEDVHLRANASLLLGTMFEDRKDQRTAISFYRQAAELVPENVDTHLVLALALAKGERWDEAIAEQWIVVEMIPDELLGWLLLGELHVKGGKMDEVPMIYGAYELRRTGLLDGLTLKREGEYIADEAERIACAEALAPAVDDGTAKGLMYALDSDPAPAVRAAVAGVMGEQRLVLYKKLLTDKLATESSEDVKEAMTWAIAEIERDGVDSSPGPVPAELAEQVAAEAKALAEAEAAKAAAEGGAAEGGAAEGGPGDGGAAGGGAAEGGAATGGAATGGAAKGGAAEPGKPADPSEPAKPPAP